MHYEINVSHNGSHFFATHERSITSRTELDWVLEVLRVKFPESEGYDITVYECRTMRSEIDVVIGVG